MCYDEEYWLEHALYPWLDDPSMEETHDPPDWNEEPWEEDDEDAEEE